MDPLMGLGIYLLVSNQFTLGAEPAGELRRVDQVAGLGAGVHAGDEDQQPQPYLDWNGYWIGDLFNYCWGPTFLA